MKTASSDPGFIEGLLLRPQMYMLGGPKFEGVLPLMFGMRLNDSFPVAQSATVQRWLAFEEWMAEQEYSETRIYGSPWRSFRQRFDSDEDAVEGLRTAYSEFLERGNSG